VAQPLSPETLIYGFEPCGDPQISPNGERIAFVRGKTSKEPKKSGSHIWLCNRDASGLRRLTWGGSRNGTPRWSPDGSTLAFVSDRAEPNGVFLMPMEGGEARELVKHPSPIVELAWSPDGRTLAFVASHDPANPEGKKPENGAAPPVRVTSRIDYKQDNRGYLGDNRTHIFLVDVESGEKRRLSTALNDHISAAWSPDGRTIACRIVSLNGMASRLVLLDVATGAAKPLTWENGVVSAFAFSPDSTSTRKMWVRLSPR